MGAGPVRSNYSGLGRLAWLRPLGGFGGFVEGGWGTMAES